jgi:hypothetical protein
MLPRMVEAEAMRRWQTDGFLVLPGHLPSAELEAAVAELPRVFPTADEFHDGLDDERNARFRDEFGGIINFPWVSTEMSLLAVHPQIVQTAESLLQTADLRVYSIEAWAKYTDAADYDQPHHRDYLNHTVLVPEPSWPARQVEMLLYLFDVPVELGPPAFVPWRLTSRQPVLPNWYPRQDDGFSEPDHPEWISRVGRPDLYDNEVSGVGPAGTVVAYRIETFHRGTALIAPRGARYTIHVNFRASDADWIGRHSWSMASTEGPWVEFVCRASPRQLELFGFPPAGHTYWKPETLAGLALRYPGADITPWTPAAQAIGE